MKLLQALGAKKRDGTHSWAIGDIVVWGLPPADTDPDRPATLEDVIGLLSQKKVH